MGKRGAILGSIVAVFFCKPTWYRFFDTPFLLWLSTEILCQGIFLLENFVFVASVGIEGLLSGLETGDVIIESLSSWMVLDALREPLFPTGFFSRDTGVGMKVVLASLGVTWVLPPLKYFIVVRNVSVSTVCLFLSNNDRLRDTVVDSPAVSPVMLALGRMLRDEPGVGGTVAATVSLSVEAQVGHTLRGSVAEESLVLLLAGPLSAGLTILYRCRLRTGVLYGLISRPLLQIVLSLPKCLDQGELAVLFLEM